jgi:hypothetical protein
MIFAITELAYRIRIKAARRAAELKQVSILLQDHYEALECVFGDPDTPDELSEILVLLSESISNRKMSQLIVSHVFENDTAISKEVLETDVDELRSKRPDLVSQIERAIATGFSAMILRWPETSRWAEIKMSEMLRKDRDREIARAVKYVRHHTDGPGTYGIAIAA